MAATSGLPAGDALGRKLGPLPVWAWAGIGVVIALYWSKKKSSSSAGGTNAMSVLSSPFGYSAAAQQQAAALGGSSLGAYYPTGYSDYSSGQDLAGVLSNLSSQITSLGAGNSGTNRSPALSPGNTQTGAANQTAPAPGSAPPTLGPGPAAPAGVPAGWQRIPNPNVGGQMAAAGVPWVTVGNAQYYNPSYVVHIPNPAQGTRLTTQGYKAITIGNAQFYNPTQKIG